MRLTHLLLALVAATLLALYVVTAQSNRERFDERVDGGGDETDAAESKSAPVAPEQQSDEDAGDDDLDGIVFKAYMDVFGVPPSPAHSKHYTAIAKTEKLDSVALKARIQKDSRDVLETMTTGTPSEASTPDGDKSSGNAPSDAELDAGMRALREKAQRIAKMAGPVSKAGGTGETATNAQLSSKLRTIASQVSALAREYDVAISDSDDVPKGLESFISF